MIGLFTPEEWRSIKDKMTKASPKLLLVLICLVAGYSFGWHMKGQDVIYDCKYANSFRFHSDAFTCARKI